MGADASGSRVAGRGAAGIVVAILIAGCGRSDTESSGGLVDFPSPGTRTVAAVSASDFAGAEACADCHVEQYAAWAGSTHGQAGGAPGPDVVIAAFDGRPIRFADATVTPRVRGGVYEFLVRQQGFEDAVYRVDGVIGKAHMLGGGTQGFISRRPDGTERFLPWDWSGPLAAWFCNTGSRTNEGWEPVRPDMRLADCGDWPPLRPIGTVDRFANCQECHGSQIRTEQVDGSGFSTDYTTLQVNCESCHGPAARHVELAESGRLASSADLGVASLAYRDKDEALAVCFQCHALKDVLEEGYLPGEPLESFYALKYPVLGDRPYTVDGRVRTFAYQGTHLASACYLQGPMDCASCHEPHGQSYWDVDRSPLASPFADGQCTACHASKAVDVETHTFHEPDSEGSRCVSCHMPYLQHPEVGDGVPFARSDHSIAIPRPVFDADIGIQGACRQCHAERTPTELAADVRARWGALKPHRALVTGMAGEFRARDLAEAAELLLHPGERDPLLQFQALSRLLEGYLRPDVESLPAVAEERLVLLLGHEDLDVRSLAHAALHWSRGDDPDLRRSLVRGLSDDDSGQLRSRWILALGFLGDRARDQGDFGSSATAYRKALELRPGDPRVLHALGQMYNRAGQYDLAADAIRRSLTVEPSQPLAHVNLGIALAGAGDPAGARQAYTDALAINPHEALAHFNLGLLHTRAGRYEEAAASLREAVVADPGLGLGHFELARTLIRLERFAEAVPHARRAVEFMPDHQNSRAMLADLERALGG